MLSPSGGNAHKAAVCAEFGNIKLEWQADFKMGVDNKTPEFLKKNPNGQVPTMDTPDGPIFESNAIAKYRT
jgi:elongation factor 1-gamma